MSQKDPRCAKSIASAIVRANFNFIKKIMGLGEAVNRSSVYLESTYFAESKNFLLKVL